MARRYDASRLDKAERTSQGFLKVDGRMARTGILTYRMADGSTVRELRLPEEVFSPSSLSTVRSGVPITIGHPSEPVTIDNARLLKIGQTVSDGAPDQNRFVSAMLQIEDPLAISKIDAGELVELSAGYQVDIDPTPGVWEGQSYDAVQRNVRWNHLALIGPGQGRSGSEVKLRLDSQDGIQVSTDEGSLLMSSLQSGEARIQSDDGNQKPSHLIDCESPSHGGSTLRGGRDSNFKQPTPSYTEDKQAMNQDAIKLKIGDKEHEMTKALADAFSEMQTMLDSANKSISSRDATIADQAAKLDTFLKAAAPEAKADSEAKLGAEVARADQAEKKVAELENQIRTDAEQHVKDLDQRVEARLALVDQARKLLGREFKADGLTDRQVREAVLSKAGSRFDDKSSDDYIRGAFEHVAQSPHGSVDALAGVVVPPVPSDKKDTKDKKPTADEVRAESIKIKQDLYKRPARRA